MSQIKDDALYPPAGFTPGKIFYEDVVIVSVDDNHAMATVQSLDPDHFSRPDSEHGANQRRLVACWNACDGISTEVLELNATAGGVATLERQRDAMRAALVKYESFFDQMFAQCCSNPVFDSWGKQVNLTDLNEAHSLGAKALASMKLEPTPADFPPLTATGTAGEGATNHTALISKLFQPTARYTSVSKGGTYERLGAMRGAGSLKGLSGIAYRDDKGSLFIREPECFAKRMVLIKPEGGV